MIFKHLFAGFLLLLFTSCKSKEFKLVKIEGEQIPIQGSLQTDNDIDNFIAPYQAHVKKELDSVLTYAPQTLSREDGALNSTLGNLIADGIYKKSNPIFNSRTGHNIDIVISNYGSIRAPVSKGNVTLSSVYELMPFENSVLVVALKGYQIKKGITYLIHSNNPHPIYGLKLVIDKDKNLIEAKIKGQNIADSKTYYVATIDYLYNGGDHMTFFKPNDSVYNINYKLRNVLIDYFTEADTLKSALDDRFTQIK